jgi:tripartite-type tricarboxylate transporter receptor subunit TctC
MGKSFGTNRPRLEQERLSEKALIACRKLVLFIIILICLLGLGKGAQGQGYPTRSINLLIGNPPGAGTDVCSRIIIQYASKALGQEIIPVNKPGGQGAVAAGIVASSKGDGYTLLAVTSPSLTNVPHLESVPFDPIKDFIPIIQFGSLSNAMIVRSDSAYKSVDDLIDSARKDPKQVSIGVPGIGSSCYLAAEHVMLEKVIRIT